MIPVNHLLQSTPILGFFRETETIGYVYLQRERRERERKRVGIIKTQFMRLWKPVSPGSTVWAGSLEA